MFASLMTLLILAIADFMRVTAPWRLLASTSAINTGMYSGSQPAMTALTAIRCTVAAPIPDATVATSSSGCRDVQRSMRRTLSAVGAMTGKPSVQRRSRNRRLTASASSASAVVSERRSCAPPASGGHASALHSNLAMFMTDASAVCLTSPRVLVNRLRCCDAWLGGGAVGFITKTFEGMTMFLPALWLDSSMCTRWGQVKNAAD